MNRDREQIDAFLPLRPVELHILLSLAAGERHGYGIIQDALERDASAVLDVGTLYRALARLSDQGLIRTTEPRKASDASDERRHYYRITPFGLNVVRAEAKRMAALTRAAIVCGLLPASAQ